MVGSVLVLGADERFERALELLIPGIRVRSAPEAVDTEGIGVDVVVIAGPHPIEQLTEVRVHPCLYSAPVVLVAPGHKFSQNDWRAIDVWPVTRQGFDLLEDTVEHVAWLLCRLHHPTAQSRGAGYAEARAAS